MKILGIGQGGKSPEAVPDAAPVDLEPQDLGFKPRRDYYMRLTSHKGVAKIKLG